MERNGKGKRKKEGIKEGKREKLSCKHCEKHVRKIYTILFHTKYTILFHTKIILVIFL